MNSEENSALQSARRRTQPIPTSVAQRVRRLVWSNRTRLTRDTREGGWRKETELRLQKQVEQVGWTVSQDRIVRVLGIPLLNINQTDADCQQW